MPVSLRLVKGDPAILGAARCVSSAGVRRVSILAASSAEGLRLVKPS